MSEAHELIRDTFEAFEDEEAAEVEPETESEHVRLVRSRKARREPAVNLDPLGQANATEHRKPSASRALPSGEMRRTRKLVDAALAEVHSTSHGYVSAPGGHRHWDGRHPLLTLPLPRGWHRAA